MRRKLSTKEEVAVEATITSKGQVTLPKVLRNRLGLNTGSRIRFSLSPQGGLQGHRVLHELEDLWEMADAAQKTGGMTEKPMTLEEMDEAKSRRMW